MQQTYEYETPWGETLRINADLTQASAQIEFEADPGEWVATPYQTADARHDERVMVELVVAYLGRGWYGDDYEPEDVAREMAR